MNIARSWWLSARSSRFRGFVKNEPTLLFYEESFQHPAMREEWVSSAVYSGGNLLPCRRGPRPVWGRISDYADAREGAEYYEGGN